MQTTTAIINKQINKIKKTNQKIKTTITTKNTCAWNFYKSPFESIDKKKIARVYIK